MARIVRPTRGYTAIFWFLLGWDRRRRLLGRGEHATLVCSLPAGRPQAAALPPDPDALPPAAGDLPPARRAIQVVHGEERVVDVERRAARG